MKKYVPLLLSSVLAFTSIQSFTVFAEGEDDGNIEEISEEGEEKAVEDTNLRILFTSDLQDHILQYKQADNEEYVTLGGYSRLANLIQLNRTENTVLIDGGNFSTGSAFSCLNSTSAPDLSLMSMFGYDAIALGDEEFTYGTQTLANMIGVNETVPTLLTGNLNYSDSEAGKALKSTLAEKGGSTYKVVERAGKKIGIFSVMKEQSISSDDVSLANAIDTAKDIVSSLNEEGCDYVIAIAHGGDAFAHEIAKSVDDINTVVASCDVVEKWEVETEGDTNIVSCGENGQYLGVLDINKEDGSISGYQLVAVTSEIEENPDVAYRINDYTNQVSSALFDAYGVSVDKTMAANPFNFTPVDHSTNELLNNNTADLITDAYALAYDDWYAQWYASWKTKKKQMLKAAQSLVDKNTEEQPAEESTEEQVEATPTPTPDTPEYQKLEEIQNMKPTVKKRAIGLISKKEIQSTFTKDSISALDAYNVVPNGTGSDGSYGESLILVFLKGSDVRKLCEYDVTYGRKGDGENQLYFSGLKYTYSDYRQDNNHVEEVYVDAVNDYYVPVHNDELYPVVTTLSTARDLLNLSSYTDGNLNVRYYDVNGGKIQKLSANVLTYKKKELKSFKAICTYLSELERNSDNIAEVSSSYKNAAEVKTEDTEFTLWGFFKNTTESQLSKYINLASGIVAAILGIKLLAFIISKKKEKDEENQDE